MSSSGNPFNLTQEELDELTKLIEDATSSSDTWGGPNHHGEPPEWYDTSWAPTHRTKHRWKPTLLLVNTVYTCSNCGAKKEEAEGDFCEEF